MFLSRVEIPWDAARNPYNLHRQLWHLFPGEDRESRSSDDETRQGFLFRIEENATGRPARLLVQSRRAPTRANGLLLVGTREITPCPSAGQRLAFVLTANPVKTIVDAQRDAKPGKQSEKCRVPFIKEEEQRQWLLRKLGEAGEVEAVSVLPHAPVYFHKGSRAGKLVTATFEGVLRVRDPDRLAALLANGIGPAKAFGCGLLLVRRI
ncbi:type I-E CRISPR-associated protein Cas6/Cse3/CasE [Sulfuriferula plumbiphila]|uniref:Type I-E CRISPR-associated protein Cas6/Cse3/CasE n=1 Tax=Sulfuriferula plumbiphila TaxID=171865 RepID=A0A512L4J5_9PROT|nr:type I-E CRISPR-associated protein Cas6/Cse3/CasE [Sulfuriferula plumbiphila]BBP03779.1 type I-E CRISPR-associated protein Cas6/Cse3/CasE [Sulfuriferula plumbiphila]GEP29392.1 type I-E CRISPR-associated protein Cas6/Cse3/CasE [Sulfuriferula plumbiphila]